MRILFVNDDGYDSYGLHCVADLFKASHDCYVVAPDGQRSAYSHSVTLKPQILSYREVSGYDYPVYAVSGTPVDCVKTGIFCFSDKPDIVISGINRGCNLGTDILYSGTVAAAIDAASLGIKAVALSLMTNEENDPLFKTCADFFYNNFERLTDMELPHGTCLNINFPSCTPKGVRTARMYSADTFVDSYDAERGLIDIKGYRDRSALSGQSDESLCVDGYITVTPLTVDKTDYAFLKKLKKEKFVL